MVIDPGVGSDRRGMVCPWRGGWLVGPDNGVFSLLKGFGEGAYEIDLRKLGSFVSTTFHGRDVFAKVAARLANGETGGKFGPLLMDPIRIRFARPERLKNSMRVKVAAIDRFGNVILPLSPNEFSFESGFVNVSFGSRRKRLSIVRTYADIPAKGEGILVGSHGFWELAAGGASFARRWRIAPGKAVKIV